eukprot:6205770-Pleurochrysis_carterae.AAC.4
MVDEIEIRSASADAHREVLPTVRLEDIEVNCAHFNAVTRRETQVRLSPRQSGKTTYASLKCGERH